MVYLLLILPPFAIVILIAAADKIWNDIKYGHFGDILPTVLLSLFVIFICVVVPCLAINEETKTAREKKEQEEQKARLRSQEIQTQKKQGGSFKYSASCPDATACLTAAGERCHFQSCASVMILKNEVVGYNRSYSGSSVNVTENWAAHSGAGRSTPIRKTVPYFYSGLFSITDQRIIMTGEEGFDHPFSRITSLNFLLDYAGIELQFGGDTYKIILEDPFMVERVINLILGQNRYM